MNPFDPGRSLRRPIPHRALKVAFWSLVIAGAVLLILVYGERV